MSLSYAYQLFPVNRPLLWLGRRLHRPRPMVTVTLIGPAGTLTRDALVDTGADDTVFPVACAQRIGLNLTTAPTSIAAGVGQTGHLVRMAQVVLRISDLQEQREWPAWIGFTSAPLRQPLLGFAGFLQFFKAVFDGDPECLELTINCTYPGK